MSLLSRLPLFCVPLFLAVPTRAATLRLLDCTIDSTTLSDCNPTNYFIRVGIFAAPGVLLFVLLWLLCPLYCMGKYCCNCCGGRKQTPNCCCPDLKYPARYSRGDLLRPRILGLIALLLAAGGVGWGLNGVLSLLDGISTVQSDFVNIPQILENQIVLIQNALTVTTYDLSSGTMITPNLFAGSGLQSAAESLRTQLKSNIDTGAAKFQQYLDYFTKIVAAVFGVPLLMILLGQLASLCACRSCCPMFIVWFIFLFGGLLWLGHGLFSGLSMVVGDACAEITGLANQQTNVLPVVLQCKDSMFDDFRNNFKQLEQTQATSTCTLLLSSCYDSSQSAYNNVAAGQILDCPDPSTINCTSIDFGTLYTLVKTTISLDANIATVPGAVSGGYYCHTSSPCTLPLCSTECLLGGASGQYRGVSGNLSLAAYSGFQAANQIANAIDTVGAQYSNCDSVIGTIMNPVAKPCSSLTTGMQYARQSSGIEGVGVIIALFVFAWGAKRFIPLDEADKPQMDGRELDDLDKDGLK